MFTYHYSALHVGSERRATTGPAPGFDEGQPGVARSSMEGGRSRSSHTTSIFHIG